MTRAGRVCAALALVAALVAGPARADTTAVAVNTHDGFEVFRLAFHIARTTQEVVAHTNAAVAVSSCEGCQTVAIAIQVVLIFSEPDVFTPTNLALAMNIQCSSCATLASAYQYLLGVGEPVRFTPEGNRLLAEIRAELQRLRTEDLSIFEIQARLEGLIERLERVLAEELEPTGAPDRTEDPPPAETPAPSDSPEASPSPSPSESPSETPSASPTPETS